MPLWFWLLLVSALVALPFPVEVLSVEVSPSASDARVLSSSAVVSPVPVVSSVTSVSSSPTVPSSVSAELPLFPILPLFFPLPPFPLLAELFPGW